jgi:hypothetical protein
MVGLLNHRARYCANLVLSIHFQQWLGIPLYFYNKDWYYAWQSLAKQFFAVLLLTLNSWFSPTEVRVSGDKSVKGQIRTTPTGQIELDFPERTVLIANHQVCCRLRNG